MPCVETRTCADVWERLKDWLQEDLAQVDQQVEARLASRVPLLGQVTHHIVDSSGKRLRPMLLLAAARLAGYKGVEHIPLAASIELIHTATLLHDDVIDDSPLRRGRQTAHLIWGQKVSILAGDFLFSQAFHLMMQHHDPEVLRILAHATSCLVEGEVWQLESMNTLDLTPDHYFRVIGAKTAALFQAACHVAGIVRGCTSGEQEALIQFGYHLGLIFQIRDDVLDYYPIDEENLDVLGDDLREGKVTLPVLLCYQRATSEEQDFWKSVFQKKVVSSQEGYRVRALLDQHDTLDHVRVYTQHHAQKCLHALRFFPSTEARQLLEDLTLVLAQCQA